MYWQGSVKDPPLTGPFFIPRAFADVSLLLPGILSLNSYPVLPAPPLPLVLAILQDHPIDNLSAPNASPSPEMSGMGYLTAEEEKAIIPNCRSIKVPA